MAFIVGGGPDLGAHEAIIFFEMPICRSAPAHLRVHRMATCSCLAVYLDLAICLQASSLVGLDEPRA
jgi:hypothetical protein